MATDHQPPQPHLLVFPFPAQGHLIPLLDFSTHLATRFSFTITVIITPQNLPLLQPSLSSTSHIQPLVLPLHPSPSLPFGAEHVRTLPKDIPLAALIRGLSSLKPSIILWAKSQPTPPSAFISDFFLGWSTDLAADLQIPHFSFFSVSALLASILHPLFISLPPPSSSPISISPSLPSFPYPHLPSIFRRYVAGNPDWDSTRDSILSNSHTSATIINTFDFLESPYLSHLSGRVFAIGPIPPAVPDSDNNNLLPYLDSCPPRSVVYICFGSQFDPEQHVTETIAAAIQASGARFIWAVGKSPPKEFDARGKVVKGWVPQRELLKHVAIGAFITHCGWNSVLDGMTAGVLLLAWPMEADQFVNARLLVEETGVAVRLCDGGPGKVPEVAELGKMIREAVEEGSWPAVKLKVAEMRRKAKEAVAEGGSSSLDLKELVKLLQRGCHFSRMNQYCIVLKFCGYWVEVKNQNRRKYEGKKQKSMKFDKKLFNFTSLEEKIMTICPWLKDHAYELHYRIPGTSPKQYKLISYDIELIDIIQNYQDGEIIEVVLSIQEDEIVVHDDTCLISTQRRDDVRVEKSDEVFFRMEKRDNSLLYVGAYFEDVMSFKQMLRTEAITNNFGVKINASDKTRIIAVCAHRGCPWRIRAALCADGQTFQVRKLEGTHLCPGLNRAGNSMATSSWVALQIKDIVKKNPDISPKLINNSLEATFGLSLSYKQLWRSRELAREQLFGSIEDNYKWVPSLRSELMHRNPGSHITYSYDVNDNSFMRFYVSFKVCIDGFLVGCRPLVGLDACHLKSKYLGVLLSANSLDGNNGLFTIAFAVVESESKKTWEWFLENLYVSFTREVFPLAFISDMEKGLSVAVRTIFPNAEHRVCIRHLWKNLKKYFFCNDSQKLKSLVWTAANTYIREKFEKKKLEILTVSPQIYAYLASLQYK